MIVMFIQGGVPEKTPGNPVPFDLINNQTSVMRILLVCALISVPTMLFVNPIITHKMN